MDNPPPIPPRPPGYELPETPPSLPPRQTSNEQYYPPPPPPPPRQQPSGWTHLLYEDGSHTPLFESLMNDFFSVLDPQSTGHLTPEAFSSFLEVNGFAADEDIWRANYKPLAGPWEAVDNADFELKAAYEAWYFPHKVVQRSNRQPLPYGGMPLLSREGFRDYLAVECAGEGPARVRGLNAALQRYGRQMSPGWMARGPLPPWALPEHMPDKVRRRIDAANERSHRTAATRIEAERVKHALMAQGRQNAIELVSDVRYVWRPY